MTEKSTFGKGLFRYTLLLIGNFSFLIAVLAAVSYFHDVLYVFIWQKNLMILIGIFIATIIIWIGTALAYIITE
jgi:hypothetical protein